MSSIMGIVILFIVGMFFIFGGMYLFITASQEDNQRLIKDFFKNILKLRFHLVRYTTNQRIKFWRGKVETVTNSREHIGYQIIFWNWIFSIIWKR